MCCPTIDCDSTFAIGLKHVASTSQYPVLDVQCALLYVCVLLLVCDVCYVCDVCDVCDVCVGLRGSRRNMYVCVVRVCLMCVCVVCV